MRVIRRTKQFIKDIKRMQRRGIDTQKLKEVLKYIVIGERLALEYRDHVLVGQYKGSRECHLAPDWLLIYELAESELILIRTGSHSDLFQ
ncbi:MAG: type II toxin-antitoxin system YafQ family toxin [Anaerolineales bacterium]|nr:type II toxin-antitoxin system YafQ family toxin [Anaerolineales bacterium]